MAPTMQNKICFNALVAVHLNGPNSARERTVQPWFIIQANIDNIIPNRKAIMPLERRSSVKSVLICGALKTAIGFVFLVTTCIQLLQSCSRSGVKSGMTFEKSLMF